MFNASIQQLESQISYHQEQCNLAQSELDGIQAGQAFADNAVEQVKETIENLEPKYLDVFKEHLVNLFTSLASPVVEDAGAEPKVFNPLQPDIPHTQDEDEEAHLIHLRDNVVYDQNTDCIHIGFRLSSDGYEWRDELVYKQKLSSKSWFEESEHLEDYPKELIIEGISLEQARKLIETCDFSNPPIKKSISVIEQRVEASKKLAKQPHYPDPKIPIKLADYTPGQIPVNKVEIESGIIYIPVDKTAYIAMKAKGRARNYGDMLTRVLTIGSKYVVSDKLTVVKDAKYEFRIFDIELEDIKQLAKFNLSKEYDHKDNKEVREDWRLNRQRPAPVTAKPSPKLVSPEEVTLGDIVYLNSIDNQYKVLSKVELEGKPHIEVINVFNSERPSLVSNISYLKECYLVPAESIQIDPQFKEEKQEEEVLTENVNIYIPKPASKRSVKPVEVSVFELGAGDVIHRGLADSQYEVIGTARKDNDLYAECRLISSSNRPHHIGEVYFFNSGLYLVEEEEVKSEPVAV